MSYDNKQKMQIIKGKKILEGFVDTVRLHFLF